MSTSTPLMPFSEEITAAAEAAGLKPSLLGALVLKESSGNPSAWNPEPRYRYLMDVRAWAPFRPLTEVEVASERPPADFHSLAGDADQEWWAQQASWGLTQVMGGVARELGYKRPYLPELVRDTAAALNLGARHLAKAIVRWGNVERGLSAYNAGGPTDGNAKTYVDVVLRLQAELHGEGW